MLKNEDACLLSPGFELEIVLGIELGIDLLSIFYEFYFVLPNDQR